jgi:hypothetical protein
MAVTNQVKGCEHELYRRNGGREVFDVILKIFKSRIKICTCFSRGPGWLSRYSDSLRAGRSGNRIPVGARYFAAVQTGPGAHPASCTMGTGSFPGVKRPGRGVDHPPSSSVRVKERVELYLYYPLGLHGLL